MAGMKTETYTSLRASMAAIHERASFRPSPREAAHHSLTHNTIDTPIAALRNGRLEYARLPMTVEMTRPRYHLIVQLFA
jgi:hypothetical protein